MNAELFVPAIVVLLLWSAFTTYVFIKSPTPYMMRWALIPLGLAGAVAFGYFTWMAYGYAVNLPLPSTFDFLGYHTVIKGNKKTAIEIWVEGTTTRLYVIPYSKKAEETLKDAAAKKKGGGTVRMQRKGGDGNKDGRDDYPYESNLLLPEHVNPKAVPEEQPDEQPEMDPRRWT